MTREQIDNNRKTIIEELRAAKRKGVEELIGLMDRHGFFTAGCDRHDVTAGGTANHSLWLLWLARQTREDILRARSEIDIPEEDLVIACLCHDICDCGFDKSITGHGRRSMEILKKAKVELSEDALIAVMQHRHPGLSEKGPASSRDSGDPREIMHYILYSSDCRSIEYGDSIPFGTAPLPEFQGIAKDAYIDCTFDQEDHRMWIGEQGHSGVFDGLETLSTFMVHHVASIPVRSRGSEDILVLSDDAGLFSLMFLSEEGDGSTRDMYRSDRSMFAWTELSFYITRFPQYRSSYIAARNAKGRWGLLRVQENRKHPEDHRIKCEKVVDFTYRDESKAVAAMRSHTGNLIRITHRHFYSRIRVEVSPQ